MYAVCTYFKIFIPYFVLGDGLDEMFNTVAQKLVLKNSRTQNNQILFEKDVHTLTSQEPTKLSCC